MDKLIIAGIRRGNQFSPNHIGNDAAIFSLAAEHLRKRGAVVNEYIESDLLLNDLKDKVIFNRALVFADNDQNILNTRFLSLFNDKLICWFINDR